MLDERLYPCLNLVNLHANEIEKLKLLLHISKQKNETIESVRCFLAIKSMPGQSWFQKAELEQDLLTEEYHQYCAPNCTDVLINFSEYKELCLLCPGNKKFCNYHEKQEADVLSTIIASPDTDNLLFISDLKPGNFKSKFVFTADGRLFILPLYHLLFQFIRSSSSLEIPDNPLTANLDTPNWERILDTFLTSTPFRRHIKWNSLTGTIQYQLLPQIKECLCRTLGRASSLVLSEDMIQNLKSRKKSSGLNANTGTTAYAAKTVNRPDSLVLQSIPDALPATEDAMSNLLQGILQHNIAPLPPHAQHEETSLPVSSEEESDFTLRDIDTAVIPIVLEEHSLQDLLFRNLAIPIHDEILHSYLYDIYLKHVVIAEAFYYDNKPYILLYIPGHGSPLYGQAPQMRFIMSVLTSDQTLPIYTCSLSMLIDICRIHEIPISINIHSLTAAYFASMGNKLLPVPSHQDIFPECFLNFKQNDMSSPLLDCFNDYISTFETLHKSVSSFHDISLWTSFEIALGTAVHLTPEYNSLVENLNRITYVHNDFFYHPGIHKQKFGTTLHITISFSDTEDNLHLQSDQTLIPFMISCLISDAELKSLKFKLLSYDFESIDLFVGTKNRFHLASISEKIGTLSERILKNTEYGIPFINIERHS